MVVTGSLQASYRGALRIYGFEGEAGREGEGATPTNESSYRRTLLLDGRRPMKRAYLFWSSIFAFAVGGPTLYV